ncbi:outer membrane protein assembly factor BamB family protein [Salinigranum salinum]|uniref:outer membrane protein assembly factor BamB family protein n=1 Tax=Salinigranum salinum TaxID=1364937 RepID=UPI001864AEA8|nr:PQQ-binding-like beta-propeller repeat protein [Salinigranum salinum]
MSEPLSRRALLATLGAAALAGCLDDTDVDPETDTDADSPSGTSTRPPTETASDADQSSTPTGDPTPPERFESAWPLPAFDPGRSNYSPDAPGPTTRIAELWRTTADAGLSAPVVADETLFVGGDDGGVQALDARTGDERWRLPVGASAGTPWLLDGRLYVPTADAIVALDADERTEAWRIDTPDRADVLVAPSGVYWLSAGEPPTVVAHARADGSERWRAEIGEPWSPRLLAGDGTVFLSSGTHDFEFWRFDADSGAVIGDEPRLGNDFPAEQFYQDGTVYAADSFFGRVRATVVDGDGDGWVQDDLEPGGRAAWLLSGGTDQLYYTSNWDDGPGLYALSTADGSVAWTVDVEPAITTRPVVAREAILLGTDAGLMCFDPADGNKLWTTPAVGGSVVVVDDLVYATGGKTVRALRPL